MSGMPHVARALPAGMSSMPGIIFILEDNPARLAEMNRVLDEELPGFGRQIEDDETIAIAWLKLHQAEIALDSLDHDLDSVVRPGEPPRVDYGWGRGVADYLATQEPTCPVIVHTSNATAGDGTYFELIRANWPTFRVYPYEHHAWVARDWRKMLRSLKAEGWL